MSREKHATQIDISYFEQCCGYESEKRCLFDPWTRIRDPEWVYSGSRIPKPYFWELGDNYLGKKF
jgi:hypothetical protein